MTRPIQHHLYERHEDGLSAGGGTEVVVHLRPTRVYEVATSPTATFVAEGDVCRCHYAIGTGRFDAGVGVGSIEYVAAATTHRPFAFSAVDDLHLASASQRVLSRPPCESQLGIRRLEPVVKLCFTDNRGSDARSL